MNEPNKSPFLQFDFHQQTRGAEALCFYHPIHILKATKMCEVKDCLAKAEQASKDGFYVAGYISYEAWQAFLPTKSHERSSNMPLLWFGVFDKAHGPNELDMTEDYHVDQWQMNQSKAAYNQAFHEIMAAIRSKHIAQINYTVTFKTNFSGNAFRFYHDLKAAQQSDFSAYLDTGDHHILSASPEMFYQQKGKQITVRPMKGTIHRGKTFSEDLANKMWLQRSEKNKYENKLTSDLMQDELKSIVHVDSLRVTNPFQVEKYPTVYQMTSTISGDLLPSVTFPKIIEALFPCGSIAGTPKRASMEVITALETNPRGVYCGAIGYLTPDNEAVFNVPIRTVVIDKETKRARYGAGGAITAQSKLEEEYNEILTKTEILHTRQPAFELLETFGLHKGTYLVYENHLKRLKESASYFDFTIDITAIENALADFRKSYPVGKWIVRLVAWKDGRFTTEINPLLPFETQNVRLAKAPIDRNNTLMYHKTTERSMYAVHRNDLNQDVCDALLWNSRHEVTEFTIGNIVVELNGKLVTPPITCGALPGTFRQQLLDEGTIEECVILIDDIKQCKHIWLINSVRKWIPVQMIT